MIIIVTIGASLSIGAPMIVILDSPYPFFFLAGFMSISIICSLKLKEATPVQEFDMILKPWDFENTADHYRNHSASGDDFLTRFSTSPNLHHHLKLKT